MFHTLQKHSGLLRLTYAYRHAEMAIWLRYILLHFTLLLLRAKMHFAALYTIIRSSRWYGMLQPVTYVCCRTKYRPLCTVPSGFSPSIYPSVLYRTVLQIIVLAVPQNEIYGVHVKTNYRTGHRQMDRMNGAVRSRPVPYGRYYPSIILYRTVPYRAVGIIKPPVPYGKNYQHPCTRPSARVGILYSPDTLRCVFICCRTS